MRLAAFRSTGSGPLALARRSSRRPIRPAARPRRSQPLRSRRRSTRLHGERGQFHTSLIDVPGNLPEHFRDSNACVQAGADSSDELGACEARGALSKTAQCGGLALFPCRCAGCRP
ncbi:hypothetical protein [Lysobacter gummosus]|uniref:hypothetical protein n=1 Tax=Lysobacter gummosus TaxID=262324 RepID=UPI003635EB67